MKVPANIIEIKYTLGNEFVYNFNYKYYQGYYYEFNDRFFVGNEFNINAPELIKADSKEVNASLANPKTYIYGTFSKIQPSSRTVVSSLSNSSLDTDVEAKETYYSKQINKIPTLIKQIDKVTFTKLQQNSFYQVASLKPDRSNLEEAEKQMPGLKAWLEG